MSTTPSAAKGARGEREVREIFEAGGFLQAQRSRAGAAEDRGDLAGIPDLTVEVKNYKTITSAIGDGLRDLTIEQANNKTEWGVLCVKRPRRGWIAVMPLDEFVRLYRQANRAGS